MDGIFDKFTLIDDVLKKLDVLADAKGVFRCGLIWDIAGELKALRGGLEKEDAAHKRQIEAMKQMQEARKNADGNNQERLV
jgi:hypothetical protein